MKNKSTLAKLLAEEDIHVVHKQMETAYFNSKSRELGLPIWKDEDMTKDIYDLMVGHEIGHALWTPLDMLEDAQARNIDHGFVNILEDVRIDKKVKNKYPGLIGIYNRGYTDLAKKDFFGTNGKDISELGLIDRINLFFKGNSDVVFSDEENVWVDRAAKTETPKEVLDLAEELYSYMEENMPEDGDEAAASISDESGDADMTDGSGMGSGESGEEGETGEGETGEGDAPAGNEKGKEDGNDATAADDGTGDDTVDGDADAKSDAGSTEGGVNSTGTSGVPKATTDSASKNGLDALRDKEAVDRIYGRIPKVDLDKIIVDTETLLDDWKSHYLYEVETNSSLYFDATLAEVEALKNESKSTVAYMVKEFEMKKAADQYARAAVSKTGSLDMGKLHTYKYNEDLFKKVTTLPGATNHGMVMVVDWSGSMADNLKGTLAQMYNLVWFCRRTQIPYKVYAFSDAYDRNKRYNYDHNDHTSAFGNKFKAGDIALHDFNLLNIFSNNMTNSDELDMMHYLWMYASRWTNYRNWREEGYPYTEPPTMGLGGTPLNDAIIAMMDLVPKFKNETGVQKVNTVFLTDGASNYLPGVFDYRFDADKNEHEKVINDMRSFRYGSYGSKPITKQIIITDPVTNKNYDVTSDGITNDLLRILKNRVPGMNVVGFFIAGNGKSGRVDKRTLMYLLKDYDQFNIMEKIKFVNKNKFLALTQLGYDEYYVLPGGSALEVENETLSDDLVGAKKGKLKTAFGKMQKGKISSRPLLNKFVSLVA